MALPKPVLDVLAAARKWAAARALCVQLSDSKSTKPAEMESAKKGLGKASEELFKAVRGFETFLQESRTKNLGKKSAINWSAVFGAISQGARAIEHATAKSSKVHVIDTEGEETT